MGYDYLTFLYFSSSEVAKHINRESYGLIFGITTFAVNIARSVFTYFALQVYRLDIRVQVRYSKKRTVMILL